MPPFYHKCSTLIVGDNMSGALALAKRQLQLSILRKSLAIFFQLFFFQKVNLPCSLTRFCFEDERKQQKTDSRKPV
jgi:hypothetical protein